MTTLQVEASPSLCAALAAHNEARHYADALAWRLSLRTAETLHQWAVPEVVVISSLLAPLAGPQVESVRNIISSFDPLAVDLAVRLADWHRQTASAHREADSATSYSVQLRSLFRECYLDLANDLGFILLLLANHDARLELAPSLPVCKQTLEVFIPLVEMLGLWSLRRKWLDRSMAELEPREHDRIKSMLADMAPAKETAFLQLRLAFEGEAQADGFSPLPLMQMTETPPGTGLRRFRENRTEDEFIERLVVRIVCRRPSDCYAVLGIVHSLGQPVGTRFSDRFDDYIASPGSNGYQALYTAIRYAFMDDARRFREMVVEVRILTSAMHTLNEWGVIEAIHRSEGCFKDIHSWWNQISDLDEQLKRRQTRLQRDSRPDLDHIRISPSDGLHGLLTRFDVGSVSDPFYVFSPRGQLFLLDEGSTPLDFAYRVHTDFGNCMEGIEVNGRSAILQQPLRNGDCVRIRRGTACIGPDFTWVTWAATPHARSKIRRALAKQAREIHEGRLAIEEALFRRIQYYRQRKNYELILTRRDLDAFLLEKAKLRLMHVDDLYDEVSSGKLRAERLVWQLVSQELACALVDQDGRQLAYPLYRIDLCDACRPVPGVEVIAYVKHTGGSAESLAVHCRDCTQPRGSGQTIDVQWAQPGRWRTLADVKIVADDCAGLLGQILDSVYEQPRVYVHRTIARTYKDGKADIALLIMIEDLHQLSVLQTRLESLPPVRQVSSFPASQVSIRTLGIVHSEWVPNPYTSDEVFRREDFYDRHPQIETIQRWLVQGLTQDSSGPLVLHGQRKTGKSSLIRHLQTEVLSDQQAILPVRINLQALSESVDMQKLAATLLDWLHWGLPMDRPALQAELGNKDPAVWLMQGLEQVTRFLWEQHKRKLLLMIDEFDVLMRKQRQNELAPGTLRSLRAIISERRDMFWLLVVADGNLYDSDAWGDVGPLFQQAHMVATAELGAEWAWRLILDGVDRCRLRYRGVDVRDCRECLARSPARMMCEDCLPSRIWQETSGMPFYVQLICHDLVERARDQRRSVITDQDLDHVTSVLLSDGKRVFDHYLRHLDDPDTAPARRAIIAAIAERTSPGEWMPYSDLANLWVGQGVVPRRPIEKILMRLKNLGMIRLVGEQQSAKVQIFPPLFHRWVTAMKPWA